MTASTPIRIIVAEDDDADFELLQMLFRENFQEAQLIRSRDGEEIVEELNKRALPQAIILDLNMPRKDGRQTLQEIKADPRWQSIPVIIFTTSNFSGDRELIKRCGGIFVNKSFALNDYVDFVNNLKEAFRTDNFDLVQD